MLSTKKLCRAGVISALYVTLTLIFAPFAFGPLQVRPAEALCILPLFYPEAIVGLFIGCALSNLASPFVLFDVCFGAGATLLAGLGTYFIGRRVRGNVGKILVGGIFPVLLNALIIPFVIVVLCGDLSGYATAGIAYLWFALSIFLTETLWVYALGTPLFFALQKGQKRSSFLK